MVTGQSVEEITDRLAAEFPERPRPELERVVGESWSLFSATHDDVVLRVVATEWYARNQLRTAWSTGRRPVQVGVVGVPVKAVVVDIGGVLEQVDDASWPEEWVNR